MILIDGNSVDFSHLKYRIFRLVNKKPGIQLQEITQSIRIKNVSSESATRIKAIEDLIREDKIFMMEKTIRANGKTARTLHPLEKCF